MSQRFRIRFLIVLLAVGLPAILAHGYYRITGDPTLQPLSQTAGEISDRWRSDEFDAITVQLDWGEAASSSLSRSDVTDALRQTLDLYNVDFQISERTVPGNRITVTYAVGTQSYGPYPLARAASGLALAHAALRKN